MSFGGVRGTDRSGHKHGGKAIGGFKSHTGGGMEEPLRKPGSRASGFWNGGNGISSMPKLKNPKTSVPGARNEG